MSLEPGHTDTHLDPIEQFLAYPFATDTEYQQGLVGILSSGVLEGKSEEEKNAIFIRSEVFYYNRLTALSITVEEALQARKTTAAPAVSHDTAAPHTSNSGGDEPHTLTFAQLQALIEQGRTDEIPNNKVIPNILSSENPSEPKVEARKKPWEINTTA
ncbi:hypothetical protein C8Q74DRAFT_1192147 [Fomes fomentarius]|nr:hypothetical protein C8Q74DRAFT_1192147 [Fomes fomentarius]